MVMKKQLGTARINDKNRIYIPKEVIDFLNIKVGDFLSFELNEKSHISIFKGHLRFLRTKNYQPPESGEERGERKHEQMAERTSTQPNSIGLDNAQGESYRANEKRVEDPAKKIESNGGEDASL